jgi:hypothetical protein
MKKRTIIQIAKAKVSDFKKIREKTGKNLDFFFGGKNHFFQIFYKIRGKIGVQKSKISGFFSAFRF